MRQVDLTFRHNPPKLIFDHRDLLQNLTTLLRQTLPGWVLYYYLFYSFIRLFFYYFID